MKIKIKHMMLDYFSEFKCLADKCNYTCCYQWNIDIKKNDYMKVKNLRASKITKEKIAHCVKRLKKDGIVYARMVLDEKGYCPFLTNEKMCGLQQECGYAILPEVCKVFPRLKNIAPVQWEEFCSTGCEQTVNLLLSRPQGLRLVEVNEQRSAGIDDEFLQKRLAETPAIYYYRELQLLFMGILQNRKYDLPDRILLMGLAAEKLKQVNSKQQVLEFLQNSLSLLQFNTNMQQKLKEIQKDPIEAMGTGLMPVLRRVIWSQTEERQDEYYFNMMECVCNNLGIVQSAITEDDALKLQASIDVERYMQAKKHFENLEYTNYFMENLMVNLMFQMQFPLCYNQNVDVWESFLNFCLAYNTFKIILTGYMADKTDSQSLVHATTVCSRMTAHSQLMRQSILDEYRKKGGSLADVAHILCC